MSAVDAELLGFLLDRYAAPLELYAAQWCRFPEDVVQEAFIELVRQPMRPEHVVSWLYRVVRNGAISAARSGNRRRKREQAIAGTSETWFVSKPDSTIDAAIASEALRSLPTEQREVIVARIWGELTFEEIAEIAEISSSTAHRRYAAGLATLRERLGLTWLTKNS